ncbi:MAG: carbamoyltransferase HypF [Bacteroidota bacterium]|nr:carbamoyltransferase HypF [Bacteroidota bacterium]
MKRLHIVIRGAVQGVGFRPFIFRLATEMKLTGWVLNSAQGVFIEVEGQKEILDTFLLQIEKEKPPRSFVQSLEFSYLDPTGFTKFEIRHSDQKGEISAFVLPDIATCPDCLKEIFDSSDRRYLYPFTNCTNCGPRFSIIEALPYDRQNTTMKQFVMCDDCRNEYGNPNDSRFHAQPNACPKCGPHIELWNSNGRVLTAEHQALQETSRYIRDGKIAAVKGLGGFHLIVYARNDDAVNRLRQHKHREEKPFALMYPSMEMIKQDCEVSILEERLLTSPESPIVLLKRKSQIRNLTSHIPPLTSHIGHLTSNIASSVSPNNPYLGIMLPYTPLHHILMRELGFPVVATSGNLSDEPICTDEREAIKRLKGIADVFLVHNRPIKRHVDDSIVRVMMGRELVLRRARGYAPLPIQMNMSTEKSMLAVGAHLKNTIALASGNNVFISQHIGDLETKEAYEAFQSVIKSFNILYNKNPEKIIADLHPAYLSTQYAKEIGKELLQVQHHYAHIASCMAENQIDGRVLGVSWDGTGYGLDGTIWGGEFLLTNDTSFERVATFQQFRLPGGEQAIREPRRTALGVLYELFGDKMFEYDFLPTLKSCSKTESASFLKMLNKQINSPLSSSVGRLFDAVASIIGLRQKVSFEGQAAMELEWAIGDKQMDETYKFRISDFARLPKRSGVQGFRIDKNEIIIDWSDIFHGVINDAKNGLDISNISTKLHNTLIEIIVDIAKRIGEKRVVLSGGCFQNKYLTERTVRRLEEEGFKPYWHQRVPPNDGGISLGQIAAAMRQKEISL